MSGNRPSPMNLCGSLLQRLARDPSGNTLALAAAAILPLLGVIGGGVDMSRSYLAQSRLQQACDAGVLAARKRLGTIKDVNDAIPAEVDTIGQRFFELNYEEGSYGTNKQTFVMTLEDDLAISGDATVVVPTTIMSLFGQSQVDIAVECEAQLTATNVDVMMVLDVTGSMALSNPSDTETRITILRRTVKDFHKQLTAAANPETRTRFGFLPYSTNVNVGHLLEDDWVVDQWSYQSREADYSEKEITTRTYTRNWAYVSGSRTEWTTQSTYAATYHPGSGSETTYVDANENVVTVPAGSPYYTCDNPTPSNTYTWNSVVTATNDYPFTGPPAGTQTVEDRQSTENGELNRTILTGTTCELQSRTYTNYIQTYQQVTEPTEKTIKKYKYDQYKRDVSNWRAETAGCMEERDTYEITDYSSVDLAQAFDLDLDLVPTNKDETKWRPMYPEIIYARSKKWDGTGDFTKAKTKTTDEYIDPNAMGMAACPARAMALTEISSGDLEAYLDALSPTGQTYHDIGMIWGGRMISPTGLWAAENADVSATKPTGRHVVFLTDGETAPYDISYSSYGLEPIDARRWDENSSMTLRDTVEARFGFACDEVKKRNVTVWVIGFGTSLGDVFKNCAGPGRYFEASDAASLEETFSTIAASLSELRISD